ncbi:MAG: hypothetical protein IJC87_05000 [Clostridia bacterium]|nr:hypothetical protein [Clostridia bacterium]
MKIKFLILALVLSLACAFGFACKKPSSESTSDSASESNNLKADVTISVNQNCIVLGVGDEYVLTAQADGAENAEFTWVFDGDSATDVVSLLPDGNSVKVKGEKIGQTKLVALLSYGEHTYYESVSVTVSQGGDVVLVPSANVGFGDDGYLVSLSTLDTETDDISLVLGVTAYKNNKVATISSFTWKSLDDTVANFNGNTVYSVGEGSTTIVGEFVISNKTYQLEIAVEVYRPQISLDEHFVVEIENLSSLSLSNDAQIKGEYKSVCYDGQSVGDYDQISSEINLDKDKLPKESKALGDGKVITLETTKASYLIDVDIYTKILTTKEDFDGFYVYAKSANPNPAIWDGYFVLGNDIAYNGLFKSKIADLDSLWSAVEGLWSNGGLYGFKGVLDGKGYCIDGLSVGDGTSMNSIFGVLHIEGVVKNISFTNASVAANSSLVCAAGGGSIENVYVEYSSMGLGTQHLEADGETINNHSATFFGFKEPTPTANITNCVIDVLNADFNPDASIKIVGSYDGVAIKNVFVIGGTEELREKSNATLSFESVYDFVGDPNAQSRYKKFDGEFWSHATNVAISNNVFEKVKNLGVNFTKEIENIVKGTAYKFTVDNKYVEISTQNTNVSIKGGVVSILDSAEKDERIEIVATSLFNKNISTTTDFKVKELDLSNFVDLTDKEDVVYYDTTEKKVYEAKLSEDIGETLYYVNEDFSAVTFNRVGETQKAIFAVCSDKIYKVNCKSVTKVISKKEDLHYVRRNYTLSGGQYDGKILGEFVMVNDIDATGLVLANTGIYFENARGFCGSFDGLGYTISNLTLGEGGLFGNLGTNATVKNVKFTNVNLSSGTYTALLANSIFNATIENVTAHFSNYVQGALPRECSGLLFWEMSWDSAFINVTLDISDLSQDVDRIADLTYSAKTALASLKSTYDNFVVIKKDGAKDPKFAYENGWDSEYQEVDMVSGIEIVINNG